MVRTFLIGLVLFLTGCATTPSPVVAEYPHPPRLERPVLESDTLINVSSVDELVQAYRSSIVKLKDYSKKLETQLDSYRGGR